MRALLGLVIGMGVLIVAGTVTLVVLLVQRAGGGRAPDVAVSLPAGNRILGIAGMEGRLAVWVEGPEGARILLLDGQGRQVGEVRTR